jgi:hypothetical protein
MPPEAVFAPEEWALLKELPFKAILAAVVVDVRGPIGAASKEMVLGARQLVREATQNYAGNTLVMGVLQDVADDAADEAEISLKDELARQSVIVDALEMSSRATLLLADRADSEEAAQYRQWVYDAAQAATAASKSGGFLGFGSERVSDGEEEFLGQLQVALGLATPDEE